MGSPAQFLEQASNDRDLQNRQIAEQQRVQSQNTVGAQLLNAINNASNIKPPTDPQTIADETGKTIPNPTYLSKKQAYDEAQSKINDMTKQYMTLNSPQQHATFAQHLHGLIFGTPTEHAQQPALSPNSKPVAPVADPNAPPAPPPPPAATAPGGGVAHPFAAPPPDHPIHGITKGIQALGDHLKAFANPIPPPANPVNPSDIAKYYRDPGAVQAERAQALAAQSQEAAQKLWGIRGETAIDVAKIHAQYTLLNTPEKARIDSGAKALGYDNFATAPPEVQDSLLKQYKTATRAPAKSIVMDPSSPTGYSAAEWDTGTGQLISYFQGVLPPRGFVPTHKVTKDQYDNITISDTTPGISPANAPSLPSATSAGASPVSSAAPAFPGSPTAQPANLGARPAGTRPVGGAVKAKPISSAAPTLPPSQLAPLDANGDIPDGVGNPHVRQFANDLLNSRDTDKIPSNARAAAEQMARQYGWEQGKFTPKELGQIQQSQVLLRRMVSDPKDDPQSLSPVVDKVFSENPLKRGLISARIHGAGPKTPSDGMIQAMQNKVALDPTDIQFIQLYQQMIGRIQGLAQLTRGSGRPSNQAVQRMISELPDPALVASPTEARNAFGLIQNELDIALAKKQWGDGTSPISSKAPQIPSAKSGLIVVTAADMAGH